MSDLLFFWAADVIITQILNNIFDFTVKGALYAIMGSV